MRQLNLGKYKANHTLPDFFFVPNNIQKAIDEAYAIEKTEMENDKNYEFPIMLGSQMYKMLSLFFKENEITLN